MHRRFRTRASLVAHTLAAAAEAEVPVPDTGSLREDLLVFAREVRAATASPLGGALTRAIVAEGPAHAELEAVSTGFWARRWEAAAQIVARAVARGELPEHTDQRMAVELVVAPIHFRTFITAEPVSDAFLASIVSAVVDGAGRADR